MPSAPGGLESRRKPQAPAISRPISSEVGAGFPSERRGRPSEETTPGSTGLVGCTDSEVLADFRTG
ncbi:MAG: hypothetical protein ABS79_07755 [Planctomycetes bacterium SCN 63-9]|nr:MAG: hypothetical protein ABS79_07755 [Planctomycetes bacterium SCN 63-9]